MCTAGGGGAGHRAVCSCRCGHVRGQIRFSLGVDGQIDCNAVYRITPVMEVESIRFIAIPSIGQCPEGNDPGWSCRRCTRRGDEARHGRFRPLPRRVAVSQGGRRQLSGRPDLSGSHPFSAGSPPGEGRRPCSTAERGARTWPPSSSRRRGQVRSSRTVMRSGRTRRSRSC